MLGACDSTDPFPDAGPGLDASIDASASVCARDSDCGDQDAFCARWRCRPGDPGTDARGCIDLGPPCAEGEGCDEEMDSCGALAWCTEGREGCLSPGDCDGDGSAHILECGGDDCDDSDADSYPGNPEICDESGHDEDCNPATLGGEIDSDLDHDGYVAATCCNADECGNDCADRLREVFPGAREICNAVDDDCDGNVDEAGAFCPVGTCVNRRCTGLGWEKTFGSSAAAGASVVALDATVDDEGNSYLLLDGYADLDEDGTAEGTGIYLVSFEAGSRYRWHTLIPTAAFANAVLVERAGTDSIIVVGGSDIYRISRDTGAIDDTTTVSPASGWDSVALDGGVWLDDSLFVTGALWTDGPSAGRAWASIVLRFDETGTEVGRRVFETGSTSESAVRIRDVGASPAGVVIAGITAQSLDLGSGHTADGAFVARLDADLATTWSLDGVPEASAVAIADDGGLAIAGAFEGTYEPFWGDAAWTTTETGAFIIVLAADGTYAWHRFHDGPGDDGFGFVDYDGRGAIMTGGSFTGDFTRTPGIGGSLVGGETGDAVWAVLAVSDGLVQDARWIGGTGIESVEDAAVDEFGNLLLLGGFTSNVTLPSGSVYEVEGFTFPNAWAVRIADIP